MLPTVGPGLVSGGRSPDFDSAFLRDGTIWTSRGCHALLLVLKEARVPQGTRVLLPAFHCPSISAALLAGGYTPTYHRVHRDLTPDIEDVERLLGDGTSALLLIHYFGFPQDAERYRRLCDSRGKLLIEDCAHTFFGPSGRKLPGETGHFAIASPRKIYALPDGGAAISNGGFLQGDTAGSLPWLEEARSAMRLVQQAAEFGSLGFLSGVTRSGLGALDRLRRRAEQIRAPALGDKLTAVPKEAKRATLPSSRLSPLLASITATGHLVAARRRNYQALATGTRNLPGCSPLFPDLPEDVVPYVFPLLLDTPRDKFPSLKRRQIPMFRWESIGGLGCPVTDEYVDRLVQLPCHQSLSTDDIGSLLDDLRQVLGSTP